MGCFVSQTFGLMGGQVVSKMAPRYFEDHASALKHAEGFNEFMSDAPVEATESLVSNERTQTHGELDNLFDGQLLDEFTLTITSGKQSATRVTYTEASCPSEEEKERELAVFSVSMQAGFDGLTAQEWADTINERCTNDPDMEACEGWFDEDHETDSLITAFDEAVEAYLSATPFERLLLSLVSPS